MYIHKLRKASIRFLHVCPSVRPFSWNSDPIDRIYKKILYLIIFWKAVEKIEFWLKPDKSDRCFIRILCERMIITRRILLTLRNVSNKILRTNEKHIVCSKVFPRYLRRLCDKVVKYGTAWMVTDDDNIMRRICFACWIIKITITYLLYVKLLYFPRQNG